MLILETIATIFVVYHCVRGLGTGHFSFSSFPEQVSPEFRVEEGADVRGEVLALSTRNI